MTLEVGPSEFLKALAAVAHAAARDEMRPILSSVLLEGTEHGFYVVACDNYRIARHLVVGTDAKDWPAVALRAWQVPVLRALLRTTKHAVRLAYDTEQRAVVATTSEGIVARLRVIDGVYPDYQKVFEMVRTAPRTIDVTNRLLAEALSAADGPTRVEIGQPLEPIYVHTGWHEEIIMPLRGYGARDREGHLKLPDGLPDPQVWAAPTRKMPDGTVCWCVSDHPADTPDFTHAPFCVDRRELVYGDVRVPADDLPGRLDPGRHLLEEFQLGSKWHDNDPRSGGEFPFTVAGVDGEHVMIRYANGRHGRILARRLRRTGAKGYTRVKA
jgi:DNA polymerase III beta subunit, central domain